jgi:hypothetical protein
MWEADQQQRADQHGYQVGKGSLLTVIYLAAVLVQPFGRLWVQGQV